MKALSIQNPWAWLIAHGVKDVENRDWDTSYRGLILIHASKRIDPNAFYADGTFGAYPGTVEDTSFLTSMPLRNEYETGGIVGYATLKEVVTSSTSPWFRGKYGFVLTQRHTVPFIPLRGQLYLFDVPDEIAAQVGEIMEQRAIEADMKDMAQIKREWRAYRLEGDETPPTPPSELWGKL